MKYWWVQGLGVALWVFGGGGGGRGGRAVWRGRQGLRVHEDDGQPCLTVVLIKYWWMGGTSGCWQSVVWEGGVLCQGHRTCLAGFSWKGLRQNVRVSFVEATKRGTAATVLLFP
jgi:hypothetical protein